MLALEEITTEQVDDVTFVNTSNNVNTQELDEDAVQKLDQVGNSEFNVESDTNNNNTKNESFVLLPSAAAVVGQDREMRKAKKCSKCSLALSNGCSNRCCKKCCLELDEPCELHRQKTSRTNCKLKNVSEDISSSTTKRGRKPKQKVALPEEPVLRVQRKPVLKNEYKEPNIMYYHETVTIFCVQDFFNAPKLSQGILNDQSRSLRVHGYYDGENATRTNKRKKNPEWQAKLQDLQLKSKKIKTIVA